MRPRRLGNTPCRVWAEARGLKAGWFITSQTDSSLSQSMPDGLRTIGHVFATPLPRASFGVDPSGRATCTVIVTIGHGRVPRVFWGTMRARGRMLGHMARYPSYALILMGVWCVATRRATSQRLKTRVRARRQIGSETPDNIPRQKNAKRWVRGRFSLLTDTMKGLVDA